MSHARKRPKRLIGYARVSTKDLSRQNQALRAHGCRVIYADKASGEGLVGRPQLAKALAALAGC